MLESAEAPRPKLSRRLEAGGLVMGVALGAFFDGILLHQVLQWHHLLSLVDDPALEDLRTQVLADGVFHVLVYLLLALGLWLVWGRREGFAAPGAGRALFGDVLIGFALWNVIDVVGFHWLAGIHRIRVGVDNPLAYDLGWLAAFGLLPLLPGLWLRLRSGVCGPGRGIQAASSLTALVLVAAVAALRPTPSAAAAVLFRPGVSQAEALAAAASLDARIAAIDRSGRVMVLLLPPGAERWSLYAKGALVVGGTGLAGCGALAI
jgi:uncharacterized membrane protein